MSKPRPPRPSDSCINPKRTEREKEVIRTGVVYPLSKRAPLSTSVPIKSRPPRPIPIKNSSVSIKPPSASPSIIYHDKTSISEMFNAATATEKEQIRSFTKCHLQLSSIDHRFYLVRIQNFDTGKTFLAAGWGQRPTQRGMYPADFCQLVLGVPMDKALKEARLDAMTKMMSTSPGQHITSAPRQSKPIPKRPKALPKEEEEKNWRTQKLTITNYITSPKKNRPPRKIEQPPFDPTPKRKFPKPIRRLNKT